MNLICYKKANIFLLLLGLLGVVTEAILVPTVDDCTFWRLLRVLADVGVRLEVCLGRRGGSDIGVVQFFLYCIRRVTGVVVVRGRRRRILDDDERRRRR